MGMELRIMFERFKLALLIPLQFMALVAFPSFSVDAQAGTRSTEPAASHRDMTALEAAVVRDLGDSYQLQRPGNRLGSDGQVVDHFGAAVAVSGDTAVVGVPQDRVGSQQSQGSVHVFVRESDDWMLQTKLIASDGTQQDQFGKSVALSGNTMLIGAWLEGESDIVFRGAAYVFVRRSGIWVQQEKLIANDAVAKSYFGFSVALDGDVAVIGAYASTVDASVGRGAAYVFERSQDSWVQRAKLVAPDGAPNDYFGGSVAVSESTVLVGSSASDVGAYPDQGAAYVFARVKSSWILERKLTAPNGTANKHFGRSVAISGDTALVGAHYSNVGASVEQGAAYVFLRKSEDWRLQAELTAPDGQAGDRFGAAVALDGNFALIGAFAMSQGQAVYPGAAYVFYRGIGGWSFHSELVEEGSTGGVMVSSGVALSGGTALLGAHLRDVGPSPKQGSVLVFHNEGLAWSERPRLEVDDGIGGDGFGLVVALQGDTAVLGAPTDDVGNNRYQGSVYIFVREGESWVLQSRLTARDDPPYARFGSSVAIDGDYLLIGAPRESDGANSLRGSAYFFIRQGSNWIQHAKLVPPSGASYDYFGEGVALSGDTAVVGAPGELDRGAAYVYRQRLGSWDLQARLVDSRVSGEGNFGAALALSGSTVVVGAPRTNVGNFENRGAAFVFKNTGSVWTPESMLTPANPLNAREFGSLVSLSGDTALIGVRWTADGGIAYVFARDGSGWYQQAVLRGGSGGEPEFYGSGVAVQGDTALVASNREEVNGSTDQGAILVFVRRGSTWSYDSRLARRSGGSYEYFGDSVALDGDLALAGWEEYPGLPPFGNPFEGAVLVFDFREQYGFRDGFESVPGRGSESE
jgi:hypothetical protein